MPNSRPNSPSAADSTAIVTSVTPTLLQAILDKPRDYYVNLHTSVNPNGAMRDQLETSKKRKHDD